MPGILGSVETGQERERECHKLTLAIRILGSGETWLGINKLQYVL